MRTVSAVGNNVRNCVAEARRILGLTFKDAPEVIRANDGDNLYRVTLATGDVVEVTVIRRTPVNAQLIA